MKKLILLLCSVAASSAFADWWPTEITGDVTGFVDRETNYTVSADNVIMTNTAAPRHMYTTGGIDIGSHTGVIFANAAAPTGDGTACFGFDGTTFKGNGGTLTIGDYEKDGTPYTSETFGLLTGFTVDGITVNLNLANDNMRFVTGKDHLVNVKNGATLNWNTGVITEGEKVKFTLESGSVLNAKFGARTVNVSKGSSFGLAQIDAGGTSSFTSFNFVGNFTVKTADTGAPYANLGGNNVISGQTVANQSYFYNKWGVLGNASVTINDSETGSIRMGSNYITMRNGASLILNSKNALTYEGNGQKAIALEVAGGSSAKFVLGADNEFYVITTNNEASVATVVLNSNALSLAQIGGRYNFKGKLFFEDFKDGLVKIDTIDSSIVGEGGLLSNIFAGSASDEANAKNLYWNSKTGYLSLTAVPEPATVAAIFGALALAFAVYRRK